MCKESSYPLAKNFNTSHTFSTGILTAKLPFWKSFQAPSRLQVKSKIRSRRAPLFPARSSEPCQGRVAAGREQGTVPVCDTSATRGPGCDTASSEPSHQLPRTLVALFKCHCDFPYSSNLLIANFK